MDKTNIIRPKDNFLIRRATSIAITAVTVIMILAVILFYHQSKSAEEAKGWVVHTYEVRGHLRLLTVALRDAENGQRSYLLTGDENYLEPYNEAMREAAAASLNDLRPEQNHFISTEQHRSIKQELAYLRKLTADNPAQQSNLDEMEEYTKSLLSYLATSIKVKQENPARIFNEADLRHGKDLMDHIRNLIRVMESEENHLLSLRSEADEISTRQSEWLTFCGVVFFYMALILSIILYQRSRARAQKQLVAYTIELERNEEELKMQQEELKASNEEIEATNEELEEKTKALEEQNMQIQLQSEELTESKRLIEEKAKELERASKYKSEFLANMSHELRTPLNSLLILARLLAANEEGNLTEEQIEEAHVIHNGGLELLGLINDILDLSKVEAGKLTLTPEEIPIDSIVKRMQQQFAPVAKDKNVQFPVKIADDLPSVIFTDAQRIEQIIKNLLSNAFKFTEQGSVTLEVRRPDITTEVQRASLDYSKSIAFSVTDTGIGIEASKFKDIFEAFQQEDGSIDRHYGGTGLGLTIARKFAHMLGGEIHVTSKKGRGSSFTLVVPVKMRHSEETVSIDEPDTDDSRVELKTMPRAQMAEFVADDRLNITERDKVLLIIEDDPNFATTLIKIARKRGYKCLAAGTGRTGLVLAMEGQVTAIILDLKLPDIDGLQVLDQLKSNLKTRHIPVHIISGLDASNISPLKKGAIGFLTKPVAKEDIDGAFSRIEELLESGLKHVLVVEDDKKTQIAIQALLKKKDVQITISGTGGEGLDQIRKNKFDCVILDLQLPDMTGFEWLEQIEESGLVKQPPVIIYTARDLSEEENRRLSNYTGSIIIKGAKSPERLLDEVTLFLHSVESTLSNDQQQIIRMQHNPDRVLKNRKILLTDDDLRNTFALSKLLKKHGMNVVIADNGEMALEKLKEDKGIELVIMDIMMPVMDGYQAMTEIRKISAFKDLPIIALTARAMPEEQEKCMAAGANDYLTKPVDIERLLTLLRVCLFKQELAA